MSYTVQTRNKNGSDCPAQQAPVNKEKSPLGYLKLRKPSRDNQEGVPPTDTTCQKADPGRRRPTTRKARNADHTHCLNVKMYKYIKTETGNGSDNK
jgi:hypothetical protein